MPACGVKLAVDLIQVQVVLDDLVDVPRRLIVVQRVDRRLQPLILPQRKAPHTLLGHHLHLPPLLFLAEDVREVLLQELMDVRSVLLDELCELFGAQLLVIFLDYVFENILSTCILLPILLFLAKDVKLLTAEYRLEVRFLYEQLHLMVVLLVR